jgi:hypothetical protein
MPDSSRRISKASALSIIKELLAYSWVTRFETGVLWLDQRPVISGYLDYVAG